jgi:hypothetical protein
VKRHRRRPSPERLAIVVWHAGRRRLFHSEGEYLRWAATAGPHETQRVRVIEGGSSSSSAATS